MPFVGSLNRAIIIGNIANDPLLSYTQQTNTPICKFTVATNRKFRTQSGETREEASFHRIVVWGSRAENLSKILTKGTKVYVEGRIVYNQREFEGGKMCKEASIRALDIIILSRKRTGTANNAASGASANSASDEDSDAILDLESLAQDLNTDESADSKADDKKEDKDAASDSADAPADENAEDDLPF